METDEQRGECVILANGLFPQTERVLTVLRTAGFVCCCDGAVEKLLAAGVEPDAIVGDGDSISAVLKERYRDIFVRIAEQEYNDLTKATQYCAQRGYKRILYVGATGLREDHTIGNIFLLPFYLETFGITPVMLTDEGVFTVHQGNTTLKTQAGQQVSLFNISCQNLTSQGLKWEIYPFTQLWQGTLNEAQGHQTTITGDGVFVVFRTWG